MRLFFSAFLLNIVIFFNEIEASDNPKKNLNLGKIITKRDKNRVNSVGTSRLTTPAALRRSSTSREQDALDLHLYQPDVRELSQQTRSKEVLDLKNKFKSRHEHSSQSASSTRIIQNDQVQPQEQEFFQTHAPQGNVRWLIEHFRKGDLSVPTEPERQIRNPYLQESKGLRSTESDVDRLYALSFREHSKLIQQGLHQGNPQLDGRVVYEEEDAVKQFENHYPRGLPHPLPPPFTSSVNNNVLPNLHKIDHSLTPAGYQKRTKNKRKHAVKSDASSSNDPLSREFQIRENSSTNRGHNPDGNPNPQYDLNLPGGSEFGSTH